MNLKTTMQTLRRIEQLLDGWQSSGEIPAIERDLARDLLRRVYEDILLSERIIPSAAGQAPIGPSEVAEVAKVAEIIEAAAPAADESALPIAAAAVAIAAEIAPEPVSAVVAEPATENTAEKTETESADESADEAVESLAGKEDIPAVAWVSPIGLVGIASSEDQPDDSDEETTEETTEEITEEPAEETSPAREFVESLAEEHTLAEEAAENADEEAADEETVGEETAGDESTDAIQSAEIAESSVVEALAHIAITPAIEIAAEDIGTAEETEEKAEEETEAEAETASLVAPAAVEPVAVEPVAVEPVAAAVEIVAESEPKQKSEIEPELESEPGSETETETETESGSESESEFKSESEPKIDPNAEPESNPVAASASAESAPAEHSAEEATANATAASTAETLEEMASRFKSVSGRRRKSRRALFSLYDDDESARREEPNGQLELSDWGIEPSSKIKHVRELFGLPVDDPDTTTEPAAGTNTADDTAPTDNEFEIEIADFTDDAPLLQRGQSVKPVTSAPKSETKPAAESAEKTEVNPLANPAADPAADPTVKPDAIPTAKATAEPTEVSTVTPAAEPTAKTITVPATSPVAEPLPEEEDADDDLSFDEAVVALDDFDDASSTVSLLEPSEDSAPAASPAPATPAISEIPATPEISETDDISEANEILETDDEPFEIIGTLTDEGNEEVKEAAANKTEATDPKEVTGHQTASVAADLRTPAAEPANIHDLFGREEKTEMPGTTTVLGEVIGNDRPTVGDSLGHRPDVTEWVEVTDDLNRAISVGERFVLLRDLFSGDQALCDRTLKRLSTFDDLDDCMIWITENFAWNANSEGAKLIMRLLERKLG